MRPIKFRAWDGKEMKPVNRIDLYKDGNMVFTKWTAEEGKEHHLMQFTGLLDKNGKEIYEGDIVRYENGIGVSLIREIEYKAGAFNTPYNDCEIIGNIYENPNLIEK